MRSQAALRTALLFRLTRDLLGSITSYAPTVDVLPVLLDMLDALDRGCTAVLRAQAWDAEAGDGVDVELDPSTLPVVEGGVDGREGLVVPVSITERARLQSLLLAGMEKIEEWLEGLRISGGAPAGSSANGNDTADANMNGTAKKEDASPATDARPDVEADSVNGASNGDRNASPGQESALERLGL